VRGDDDGGPEPIELDEKAQETACERRIDVAGRLVREQKLGAHDEGTRDGGALLLAARQHRRQRVHALAEPDPAQSSMTSLR
jgi:hypothetical protein